MKYGSLHYNPAIILLRLFYTQTGQYLLCKTLEHTKNSLIVLLKIFNILSAGKMVSEDLWL